MYLHGGLVVKAAALQSLDLGSILLLCHTERLENTAYTAPLLRV